MNSFEVCFGIILAFTLCLANGQKANKGKLEILYNNQPIESFEEKLPNTKEFKCKITGWKDSFYPKTIVKWYLGDQLIHTAKDRSSDLFHDNGQDLIYARLKPEKIQLKEEHYGKKLNCEAKYEDKTLKEDVTLLMPSKFRVKFT